MQTSTTSAVMKGCFTWFEPKPAVAEKLHAALEEIGLGEWAPKPETPESALQRALATYGEQLAKVRTVQDKLKHAYKVIPRANKRDDGFELVDITRKTGPNSYACECGARVIYPFGGPPRISVTDGFVPASQLQEAFEAYCATATGSAVGRSLVDLTRHMHGTCVRLHGGVYYLPEESVGDWHSVIDAYERCSDTRVTRVMVVLDEMSARTIREGIVKELITEAAEVAEQLRQGDCTESMLERRKERSQQLRAKARMYEEILSDTLTEVHAVLDMADTCAAAAIGIQEDSQVFEAAFE